MFKTGSMKIYCKVNSCTYRASHCEQLKINKAYCKQPNMAIKTGHILTTLQKGLDKTNHGFPPVKRHGKTNHGFPHLSQMGSFPWEEHGPWMRSMLS